MANTNRAFTEVACTMADQCLLFEGLDGSGWRDKIRGHVIDHSGWAWLALSFCR